MLNKQEVPLPFDHILANSSNSILQSASASLSIDTMQNITTKLCIINAPELAKTIQNYI